MNNFLRYPFLKLALLSLLIQSAFSYADTITVGKGIGIVWSGLPYSYTQRHDLDLLQMEPRYGMVAISDIVSRCMPSSQLTNIGGYEAYKIAPGIGIIPIANVSAIYWRKNDNDKPTTMSGHIGIPETQVTTSAGETIGSSASYAWCVPPSNEDRLISGFFAKAERTASINGYWAIVADGTQTSDDINVKPMYFGSFTAGAMSDDIHQQIFPSDIVLRVNNLHCNVDTPALIDFGSVSGNLRAGAQLAEVKKHFNVQCFQDSDRISTNLNVQFRATSGLYQGNKSRLALQEGGGYITGEIGNGVTGSGQCTADSGVSFDNTQLKIGQIADSDTSRVIQNEITWRLCSGGKDLPFGDVHAATEVLVTFN